jgi:hypothetical protein
MILFVFVFDIFFLLLTKPVGSKPSEQYQASASHVIDFLLFSKSHTLTLSSQVP